MSHPPAALAVKARRLLSHAVGALRRRFAPQAAQRLPPVNLNRRDASEHAIAADVDYGMQIIDGFQSWMASSGFSITGARVLELGPGVNLAGVLGLKALGAREAIAADRWLAPWQADYSPVFCRRMAERIRRDRPDWNADVFEQVSAHGYDGVITLIPAGAEDLADRLDGEVDAVLSNAVLEHVADHAAMAAALASITRPGGMGFHQVDFRFHGDFSRPLDHLLDAPEIFDRKAKAAFHEFGCQLRPRELADIFTRAGFQTDWRPGGDVDADYLAGFLTALRASASAYRNAPEDLLRPLDAFYVLRRPAVAG